MLIKLNKWIIVYAVLVFVLCFTWKGGMLFKKIMMKSRVGEWKWIEEFPSNEMNYSQRKESHPPSDKISCN